MNYEYYAENHDWDMTLRAASYLARIGQLENVKPEHPFSCFTGSMILSFCAIESFLNSIAFMMPKEAKYNSFDYEKYKKAHGFWTKLKMVCSMLNIEIDQSSGDFAKLEQMRLWRVSLVHSSPYAVETTEIDQPSESTLLHEPFQDKDFVKQVTRENAISFCGVALNIINLIEEKSGLKPRAMARYKVNR